MSFDFPLAIQQDIQEYALTEHITADEAALKLVQVGLKALRGKEVAPLTDRELKQFKELYPGLGQLGDVTDEQWDRIVKGARKMNKEGFPARA